MSGILLATGYTALLLLGIRRIRFFHGLPGLPVRWVGGLLVLKILAGTALWAIYTWQYTDRATADVFKYFDDSAVMFGALAERPVDYLRMVTGIGNDTPWFTEQYYRLMNNWFRQFESNLYNDAHTIIRFNAVVRLFSFGEFHVHTVFAAFLSLTGMVGLYRAFAGFVQGRERALLFAVFLLPSVLLWASGVIKESLLFFGLGLLVDRVLRVVKGTFAPKDVPLLVLAGILLFFLKVYVLASLLPALVLFAWQSKAPPLPIKALLIYGTVCLLALGLPWLLPGLDVLGLLALKQQDFIGLAHEVSAGSFVMPPKLEPTVASFLVTAPYALYIALCGPLVHMGNGLMGLFAATENVFILLVCVLCVVYMRPWRTVHRRLLLALLLYVVVLALIIGWTTPVMGAVVRYRTPLLPFLLIAFIHLLDQQKLVTKWPPARWLFPA